MKRREFLKYSGLATGSFLVPGFLSALDQVVSYGPSGKRLVIIQLSGGLDGLSAVVPYRNDIYYSSRRSLAIAAKDVLRLDDEMGLHPAMKQMRSLYDDGLMTIINNVGYPNANRSHFRSMDIWHTASDADKYWSTGWLGRYLDQACSAGISNGHMALETDDTLSLAMKGNLCNGLAVSDIKKLHDASRSGRIRELAAAGNSGSNPSLQFLYKTLASSTSSIDYLKEHSVKYRSSEPYPAGLFGKQLRSIGELIIGGGNSSIYYASLSGFDTHAGQQNKLNRLLNQFSQGLSALVNDLKKNDQLDSTAILVFSEFGRRVRENGSGGTDHGAGSNLYLLSGRLKHPGILNGPTDLGDLDNGDVRYKIDFRQVYASLLDNWLGADHTKILNKTYKNLDIIA